MGKDHGQSIGMLRADVNEVDIEAVDLGDELRQGIQLRLRLPPVVAGAPILDERLDLRELYTLRLVIGRLTVGPADRSNAPAELHELLFRNVDAERADRIFSFRRARPRGCGGARGCR